MPHRGRRVQATVRLPVDEYREVATRARARGWSMSDYIGWCVAQQVRPKGPTKTDPLLTKPTVTAGARAGREVTTNVVRSFDDA